MSSIRLAVFALLCLAAPAYAATLTPLTLTTASGEHAFEVEVATSSGERARGLMYRRELAPDHGMLFDFGREQPVSFWMKNTYVPLDMVFIRQDGTVASVARGAKPLDETPIPSGAPVQYVLEVVAGTADRLAVAPGDHIMHERISP